MNTNKLIQDQFIGIILTVLLVGTLVGHFIFPKTIIKETAKEVSLETGECKTITPTTYTSLYWVLGDPLLDTLIRCDKNSCDSYPMKFSQSGIFTNVQLENSSGSIFKFVNMDEPLSGLKKNDFVEINTLGLTSYILWGTCKETSSGTTNIKSLKCVPFKQIVCSFPEK